MHHAEHETQQAPLRARALSLHRRNQQRRRGEGKARRARCDGLETRRDAQQEARTCEDWAACELLRSDGVRSECAAIHRLALRDGLRLTQTREADTLRLAPRSAQLR